MTSSAAHQAGPANTRASSPTAKNPTARWATPGILITTGRAAVEEVRRLTPSIFPGGGLAGSELLSLPGRHWWRSYWREEEVDSL